MSTDQAIDDLMIRWEAARRQGKNLAPEELCGDCPHLADEIRGRIRAVLAMERVMGVTDQDPHRTMIDAPESGSQSEPLPRIPGYDVLRVIDQGGMGVVYEARQIELGRIVAIKMISGVYLRPKVVARFRTEAAVLASLQHPGFVQIFEIGEINGRPFFSMEYVRGGSLAEMLTRHPLTARQAAELVETLARAVHAAHARGIVHRDLKPSNVMLTEEGLPKIADFGLAKRLDDDSGHTHTGEILGTPSYMAPEQAEGKKDQIGPHTDVYALGAILYELLAGKPPFQASTPLESLRRVVAQEPAHLASSVPRDLEAICLKCLEKAPSHRYVSAQALADDLRRYLNGQPVTARRTGPIGRLWKGIRRHPQAVGLAGTLGLLALIPVYFVIAHFHDQQRIRLKAEANAPLVREILQRNCYECHGQNPNEIQKGLDILNYQRLIVDKRRIVVPGSPKESRLIQRIEDGSMPPEKDEIRLPRVSEAEIVILRDWIAGGAPAFPSEDSPMPISAVPNSALAAKVKKIFINNCYECHSYKNPEAGVKILHHRLLVNVHTFVVPGDPDKSELFQLLKSSDDSRMPKDRDPLTQEEIETIRQWILEGAPPFPKGD